MKKLESVGCAILPDGNVYALNVKGTIGLCSDPVHLDDCSDEWYDNLSFEDRQAVLEVRFIDSMKKGIK